MEFKSSPLDERHAAIESLFAIAGKSTGSLSPFSGWLMAGVGAAFSLMLVNIENVSRVIRSEYIRWSLVLLLISIVISVLAKLLATIVAASIDSHKAGFSIEQKIQSSGVPFNVKAYMQEVERGLFSPIRRLAFTTIEKIKAGDIVASARLTAKLDQFHAILVFIEAFLVIAAAFILVAGLRF